MADPTRRARTWTPRRVREILDKTQWLPLEAEVPELGPGERRAIEHVIEAGRVIGELYEAQRHREAHIARRRLLARHEALGRPARTLDLLRLYRLFDGPIATTLDNQLEPFLPVGPWRPGGAMYPDGVEGDEVRAFAEQRPELRADLLGSSTIIRRTTPENLAHDLRTLARYPVLAGTHPGLLDHLKALSAAGGSASKRDPFYAVGYAVAWPRQTLAVVHHLREAARAVERADPDLSAFLRLRSLGTLADDVEVADPAWVRGAFKNLEVVAGPWEVYDDGVMGLRASHGLALLSIHEQSTREVRDWASHVDAIDAELTYEGPRRRNEVVPMASYDLLAVFGAARNVLAETLPNDPEITRRYGRRILMRRNFGLDERAFASNTARYAAVMTPEFAREQTVESTFTQTVAHELAHYVGPDRHADGRTFADSLGEDADIIEELKAEVMSFSIAVFLERAGEIDAPHRRGVLAALVHAGLRINPPLRSQTYPIVRTMIVNRFLADGVLIRAGDRYAIDHDRALATITPYVDEIIALQSTGTRDDVAAYIDRWVPWGEDNRRIGALVGSAPVRRYSYEAGPFEPAPEGLEGDFELGRC
ncbi:MAG TPA: hypothetical protein VJ850_01555 [Candidatus Limnocylindrales bacterium]|nr:hypothetical protein [Candidatus Limnocylindrales bacterium]